MVLVSLDGWLVVVVVVVGDDVGEKKVHLVKILGERWRKGKQDPREGRDLLIPKSQAPIWIRVTSLVENRAVTNVLEKRVGCDEFGPQKPNAWKLTPRPTTPGNVHSSSLHCTNINSLTYSRYTILYSSAMRPNILL